MRRPALTALLVFLLALPAVACDAGDPGPVVGPPGTISATVLDNSRETFTEQVLPNPCTGESLTGSVTIHTVVREVHPPVFSIHQDAVGDFTGVTSGLRYRLIASANREINVNPNNDQTVNTFELRSLPVSQTDADDFVMSISEQLTLTADGTATVDRIELTPGECRG